MINVLKQAVMQDRRRGAALIIVLIFAALLSNLAVAAMQTTMSGARAAAVFLDEMKANELGQGAVLLLAQQLVIGNSETRRAGSFVVHLPRADIAVDYVSEAARVDVNVASPRLLSALFVTAGMDRDRAEDVAGRIDRSRRALRSSDQTQVAAAGQAGAAMARTEQVIDNWQLPAATYRTLRATLTVSNKTPRVDPVLADVLVITALMDGDEDRARDFIERRRLGFNSADDALAQFPPLTRQFTGFAATRAVHAVVDVTVSERFRRSYDVVMSVPDGNDTEARVISWQPLP